MLQNSNTWFNSLAFVDKSFWNFPKCWGLSRCFPMDDCPTRDDHSCLLDMDDFYRRIGVHTIFNFQFTISTNLEVVFLLPFPSPWFIFLGFKVLRV